MEPTRPACLDWPLPIEPIEPLIISIYNWQLGCAFCGAPGSGNFRGFELDHDHATTLVRGFLCRLCNTREATDKRWDRHVFDIYRVQSPATLLGIEVEYRVSRQQWYVKDIKRRPWRTREALAREVNNEDADQKSKTPVKRSGRRSSSSK